MKAELKKISKDLERGNISENKARVLLLGLLRVSESALSIHKLTIGHHAYGIYQLREDGEYLMEGEELECHEWARRIIKKSPN